MQCVVTAGPTYEPLDKVRRLTNLSTGGLGSELANFLAVRGHAVRLLISQQATWQGKLHTGQMEVFTTTADLRERLRTLAGGEVGAVFHAAAVSDFAFGKVWRRSEEGELKEVSGGKLPTREGPLLAELRPTPKVITELRGWFPQARLVGWKYEVEGDRAGAIRLGAEQIAECRTDACVANGAGYGAGFGLVQAGGGCTHLPDKAALFAALEELIHEAPAARK